MFKKVLSWCIEGMASASAGVRSVAAATMLGLSVLFAPVHAALPTGIDTAVAAIQTDAESLSAIVFPVMLAILGLFVIYKLTKRFVRAI